MIADVTPMKAKGSACLWTLSLPREVELGRPLAAGGRVLVMADGPHAQLELAKAIGVTASVVVDMLDELEELDAVRRVRDTVDRRRQLIELTPTGRELRRRTRELARENDEELLGTIDPTEAAALRRTLGHIAAATGLMTR